VRRGFWHSLTVKVSFIGLVVGLAACAADVGESEQAYDDEDTLEGTAQDVTNPCGGKAEGAFICTDNTHFDRCLQGSPLNRAIECAKPLVCRADQAAICVRDDGKVVNPPAAAQPPAAQQPAAQQPAAQQPAAQQPAAGQPPTVVVNANGKTPGTFAAGAFFGTNGVVCNPEGNPVGAAVPKFDPSGRDRKDPQFITGRCFNDNDCRNPAFAPDKQPLCAKPCGICSGHDVCFQNGKQGCGFVFDFARNR
jgi:hypothetical protein